MSEPTLKSFANLHQDYAFFESHVNETEASLVAWLPLVRDRWSRLKALDFGAGSGSFTSHFFEKANFGSSALELTLVEPDAGFRAQAQRTLAPYTDQPIAAWPLLDQDLPPTFDLIFSHHVMYYVPNLEETLRRMHGALREGGRMLLVQGGEGNAMNRLVWAAFALMGGRSPYHYSGDTLAALQRLGVEATVRQIHSVLSFPDSEEGRWRILRFLMGEHLSPLADDVALSLFEPYVSGDRVVMESSDELFVIDA